MKAEIHPTYAPVVFRDLASGELFLTRSTATSDKTISYEGAEYPVIDVEISSASHPFYTGTQKSVDNLGGRVEKFLDPKTKADAARKKSFCARMGAVAAKAKDGERAKASLKRWKCS